MALIALVSCFWNRGYGSWNLYRNKYMSWYRLVESYCDTPPSSQVPVDKDAVPHEINFSSSQLTRDSGRVAPRACLNSPVARRAFCGVGLEGTECTGSSGGRHRAKAAVVQGRLHLAVVLSGFSCRLVGGTGKRSMGGCRFGWHPGASHPGLRCFRDVLARRGRPCLELWSLTHRLAL